MNPAAASLVRAGLIGAVSGLRSQWGMAAVSWSARPGAAPSKGQALLTGPWARASFLATAVGEFVADKSPHVPSRLAPASLGPRLALGALSGTALSRRHRHGAAPWLAAAATGASAACAFAFAGAKWRQAAGFSTDAVAAALEDVSAAALAWVACAPHGSRTPHGSTEDPHDDTHTAGAGDRV